MTRSEFETPKIEVIPPVIINNNNLKTPSLTSLTLPQLIETVSWIMDDIITCGGKAYVSESEIPTKIPFHAKTIPAIKIKDYLERFTNYAKCQEAVLLYALIYLDRIGELVKGFGVDSFNVHKLLLISMTEACKFLEDNYFTNKYYADVGGISVEEFNRLEEEYLMNYIQFQLYVKAETYKSYEADVARYYFEKLNQRKC